MAGWISVNGFPRYAVNENGEIKNVITGKILKQSISKSGYCIVDLWGDGGKKSVRVHRVVAETFLPNPENKPDVNHINGAKTDNRLENLEWATRSENLYHKCRVLGKKPKNQPNPKIPVKCVETGEVFESMSVAAIKHNTQPVHISECINGKRKTAGKVHWIPLPEPPKEDSNETD